jgi:hypothetical protein
MIYVILFIATVALVMLVLLSIKGSGPRGGRDDSGTAYSAIPPTDGHQHHAGCSHDVSDSGSSDSSSSSSDGGGSSSN